MTTPPSRAAAVVAAAALTLAAPVAQAAPGILIDETFGAQTSPANTPST